MTTATDERKVEYHSSLNSDETVTMHMTVGNTTVEIKFPTNAEVAYPAATDLDFVVENFEAIFDDGLLEFTRRVVEEVTA